MKKISVCFSSIIVLGMCLFFISCADEGDGGKVISGLGSQPAGSIYKALSFSGSSEISESPGPPFMVDPTANTFGFALWIKPVAIGSRMGIYTLDATGMGDGRFDILINSGGYIEVEGNDVSNTKTYTSATLLSAGTTYFVGIVYNAGTPTFYINDITPETPGESGVSIFPSGGPDLKIGVASQSADHFIGNIHAIAYWDTALSAAAITDIYNSGSLGFDLSVNSGSYTYSSNLQNWWKLGEDEANIGKDLGLAPLDLTGGTLTSADIVSFP